MASLPEMAKKLAKHGRNGDNAILHVSKEELKGLAALAPGGKLPKNPDTGQPEAFFFLPFLAGLGSMFGAAAVPAAATAAALPAAAAGAGALGAGLTAGMTAASTLPAIAAPAAAGLSSLAATAPATLASAAAPAATAGLSSLASTAPAAAAIPSGVAALPAASQVAGLTVSGPATAAGLPEVTAALPAIKPAATAAASPIVAAPPPALSGIGSPGPLTPKIPLDPNIATQAGVSPVTGSPVVNAAGTASSMTGEGGIAGLLGGIDPTMLMMGASALSGLGGGGGKDEEEEEDVSDVDYEGGEPVFPGPGYRGGIDPEHSYFKPYKTKYASGGEVKLDPAIAKYKANIAQASNSGGGNTRGTVDSSQMRLNALMRNPPEGASWETVQGPNGKSSRMLNVAPSGDEGAGIAALPMAPPLSGYDPDYQPGIDPEREMFKQTIPTSPLTPGYAEGGRVKRASTKYDKARAAANKADREAAQNRAAMDRLETSPMRGLDLLGGIEYMNRAWNDGDLRRARRETSEAFEAMPEPLTRKNIYTPGIEGLLPHLGEDWQMMHKNANGTWRGYMMGGMVKPKGYAAGGIAELPQQGMQGLPATPAQEPAVDMKQPVGVGDIPTSPYPKTQIGTPSKNDKELIAQTVEAIKGNVADPGPILLAFVNTFGEPALEDLANRVKSVDAATPNTDTVPAMLTPGEYVIKKDAVDKIGVDKLDKLNASA